MSGVEHGGSDQAADETRSRLNEPAESKEGRMEQHGNCED